MWRALSGEQRSRYDEARISYHSELVVVATSTVREVARQGRLLTLLNRREISARRGLIVSGLPAMGKSTALKRWAGPTSSWCGNATRAPAVSRWST